MRCRNRTGCASEGANRSAAAYGFIAGKSCVCNSKGTAAPAYGEGKLPAPCVIALLVEVRADFATARCGVFVGCGMAAVPPAIEGERVPP